MELLATYDLRRQVLMGYLFGFESSRKVRLHPISIVQPNVLMAVLPSQRANTL